MTVDLEQLGGLVDHSLASGTRSGDANSVASMIECVDSPIALGGRPTLTIDNLLGLKHLASLSEDRVGQPIVDIEKSPAQRISRRLGD